MHINEKRRQALVEILKTVVLPVVFGIGFFVWLLFLVKTEYKLLFFPLSSVLLSVLYFFSGFIYGGVMLAFLVIVGFLSFFLAGGIVDKSVFFLETLWLCGLFLLYERFRWSYQKLCNSNTEIVEVLETKITLSESKLEEDRSVSLNLNQRISNYQLLGKVVETLSSSLQEEKLIPLIEDLASKFIGKGTWKLKKGFHNDIFTQYIKNQEVPLIVSNLATDNRFAVKNPRFLSLVAVPIGANQRFWGILKGVSTRADFFDESDLRLLSVIGGIASLAITNSKLYQRTQELAITDGLTGLYVQSYFRERLSEEILRSKSHSLPLSVAILDVDHFKNVNDTYGHSAGDVALRQISDLLRHRLRETDFVSRYGGEEFAVIMPQTDPKEAHSVLEEIRKNTEEEKFFLPVESFHPVQIKITVSIGVASLGEKSVGEEKLLKLADEALYKAKSSGRNRTEVLSVKK